MGPGSTALPAAVPVPLPRRRRSELAFLPGALEVIDTPASPAARYTAGTIAAFLVVAVGWSCLGQVDIIATAPGRVVPAGRTKAC